MADFYYPQLYLHLKSNSLSPLSLLYIWEIRNWNSGETQEIYLKEVVSKSPSQYSIPPTRPFRTVLSKSVQLSWCVSCRSAKHLPYKSILLHIMASSLPCSLCSSIRAFFQLHKHSTFPSNHFFPTWNPKT